MKIKSFKIALFLSLASTFYACNDEQPKPDNQEGNPETKQIVTTKSMMDRTTFMMFGSEFRSSIGGRRANSLHRFSGLFKSKEEAARTTDDWDTCALVTISENEDGSWTVILNFGDGCVDGDVFTKGIVAFTGSETDSSGVFKIGFDDFAQYTVGGEVEDPLTVSGWYDGAWSADTTEQVYAEAFKTAFEINHESGLQEKLIAEGALMGNANGFVVNKYDFHAENSNGDSATGVVVHPLVFDYSCENLVIFTEGTEAFQVNGNGAVVDYGHGECDNILTIAQDGIIVIINLDEING